MCINCQLHERHLLGPHCELDSRKGHQLCHWKRALAGQLLSSPTGWTDMLHLKMCASLSVSHTCEQNQSLLWQELIAVTSHCEEQLCRFLFPRFSSNCLSPDRILGNGEAIAFVFILSGFLLPLFSDTFQKKKKKKRGKETPLLLKIKDAHALAVCFLTGRYLNWKLSSAVQGPFWWTEWPLWSELCVQSIWSNCGMTVSVRRAKVRKLTLAAWVRGECRGVSIF